MTGLTDYKVSWETLIRYCTAHGCTIVPLSIRVQQLQLRYTGHVARMSFERIQKTILYSKHATGGPNPGPKRSFQHNVTTALRNFAVDKDTWEESARHRKSWKNLISKDGLKYCIDRWLDERKLKRAARHSKIAAKAAAAKEAAEGVGAPTTTDVIYSDAAATVRRAHGEEPAGAEHHSHNEESGGGSEVTTDNEDVSYTGAEASSDSASSEDENTHICES